MVDKKALKILFDTYWSSKGWKKDPSISPDDFAYARLKGYIFPSKIMSHDDIVDWKIDSFTQIKLVDITHFPFI
jgi:hypothetical protein